MQSIPTLVLLDGATGEVITTNGRMEIPKDKSGVGFPYRSPIRNLARFFVPRPLRRLIAGSVDKFKRFIFGLLGGIFGRKKN